MRLSQNDLLMSRFFLAKSHNYWAKIADFLIKAYILSECQFSYKIGCSSHFKLNFQIDLLGR